jgi:hypothetical protein
MKGMVHALRRAGQRLRPGGSLISIRPHRTSRPLVSIITPSRRVPVARLINSGFDDRLAAAEAALARVVAEGRFTLAGIRNQTYRARLDNPSQLRTYLELISPPRPRFPPGTRARLLELWGSRARGSKIEIVESIAITALRRR